MKTTIRFFLCLSVLVQLAGCADDSTIGDGPLCSVNPCQNGGTCVDVGGQEGCECAPGYTGILCDLDSALPCDPNPCLNSGVCSPTPEGGYSCACDNGYTGGNCEVPPATDPCDPNPCMNAGTCLPLDDGGTSCVCAAGFEGDLCEQEVAEPTPCDPNPCLNGGTCVPGQDETYSCICAPGYEGVNCENMGQDPCEPNPCLNGGVCGDDGAGGFSCACAEGFEGELCESQMSDVCSPNPCQNGGTCMPNGDEASCICPAGYEGDFCESEVTEDPCLPNPCQNGGACSNVDGNAECICDGGYTGMYCEIPPQGGVCDPNPCQNGGGCVEDALGNASCECIDGFTGQLCEQPPGGDPCSPNPCENGGACDPSGGFACQNPDACDEPGCVAVVCVLDDYCCDNWDSNCANCAAGQPGFLGLDCSSVGDACVIDDAYSCTCLEGFSGTHCEVEAPEPGVCDPNPCLNGGSCADMGDGVPMCTCVDGYTGELCEVPPLDPCEAVLCENGGLCEVQGDEGVCVCPPGFEGPSCEEVLNQCEPNPCMNGGSCSEGPDGVICACVDGYTGNYCEFPPAIDPCEPNPCLNGGSCNDVGSALCQGELCEIPACVDAVCALDAFCCDNWDGSCADCAAGQPGIGGIDCSSAVGPCSEMAYECTCPEGFDGPDCEIGDDPCTPNPCLNAGTCLPMGDGYQCECAEGYSGPNCSIEVNGCDPNPCLNGGTCEDFGPVLCQEDTCNVPACLAVVCELDGACCMIWDSYCKACAAGGPGYQGIDCTSAIDACTGEGGEEFMCSCIEGYEGEFCETNIDDCSAAPCLNGGICVDGVAAYSCECVNGYTGPACEFPPANGGEACDPNPCADGEICTEVQSVLCQGETCDIAACQNAVAQLDPFCVNNWDSFCAQCAAGGETWLGDDCSGVVGVCSETTAECSPDGGGGDGECQGWSWNGACWYTSPMAGMSCDQVCADKGGFDILGSQHDTNDVGMYFYPDKVPGDSNWATIECSSIDNDTNWPANGEVPDGSWSHEACHVNCACVQ